MFEMSAYEGAIGLDQLILMSRLSIDTMLHRCTHDELRNIVTLLHQCVIC